MGGRGSGSSSGGVSGGLKKNDIVLTSSLISERERHQAEVDATLTVLRDVQERYGINVEDARVAVLKGRGRNVLGYYDDDGNLGINTNYFDMGSMDSIYDSSVVSGYHPKRGNKSGIEAVTAHEMGHRLTDVAGERAGNGRWQLDSTARDIVARAAKATGYGNNMTAFSSKVSGYARGKWAETVAEAFADVYCNGNGACNESKAVVNELNKYF